MNYSLYNKDCISGCKKHIEDNSVDLIITDPPYGINGDTLHKHYNRDEKNVLDGYVEIPIEEYGEFSKRWIKQAERILRPSGSIYIVSGYTNLYHILDALKETSLKEVNHIIWKYNFGVHTKNKFVSSHYHILYWVKPRGKPIFNTYVRFSPDEKDNKDGSLNYHDREDVWVINREYKPGKIKNKNELPKKLLSKMIQYSSNENDLVCDMFLGGFSTAHVAVGLNRRCVGFEISKSIYEHGIKQMKQVKPGELTSTLRKPNGSIPLNQGKSWSTEELLHLQDRYKNIYQRVGSKGETIKILCEEFGRGRFSITNALNKINIDETHISNLDEYI